MGAKPRVARPGEQACGAWENFVGSPEPRQVQACVPRPSPDPEKPWRAKDLQTLARAIRDPNASVDQHFEFERPTGSTVAQIPGNDAGERQRCQTFAGRD
jgi:hypothetical protein